MVPLVIETFSTGSSSDLGGGERVDDGDFESGGDANDDTVPAGTTFTVGVDLAVAACGAVASGAVALVDGECEMEAEACWTSWVKFSGPLAFVRFGRSCLVDHWRRCW